MHPQQQPTTPITVRSFIAAIWLLAHRIEPVSAGLDPETGGIQYVFPAEARVTLRGLAAAKEKLNRLNSGDAS
jgi:hypothetical protein